MIVGLGLLGESYSKVLKRFGFHISAITFPFITSRKITKGALGVPAIKQVRRFHYYG